MVSNVGSPPRVLVADDEEEVADVLALWVRERYDAVVAYGGQEALSEFDEDVDAVLLDRRMPDVHGDDVLAEIRERGHDCVVVMTTAVDPELNILEMDFDDYLSKPIGREALLSTLDRHLHTRRTGDPQLAEFFSTMSKIEVLEEEYDPADLADSEEYAALRERARDLASELKESHPEFPELVETFREISR